MTIARDNNASLNAGGGIASPGEDADVYRCTNRRVVCANLRFEILFDRLETKSGQIVDDYMIVRPKVRDADGVAGICILPEYDGKIGLMRSFRHHLDVDVWQAPAGFLEAGETPAQSARRELREEVRFDCADQDLVSLGTFLPDAGLIEARVALFVARNCFALGGDRDREPGTGGVTWFTPDALATLLRKGAAMGASSLVVGYRYLDLLAQDGTTT